MSQSHLSPQQVAHIAKLAALKLDEATTLQYATGLNRVLELMDALQQVPTDNVLPMHSPFAVAQPLRADVVTEGNQRDVLQAVAPAVEAGCFLVPRVIE